MLNYSFSKREKVLIGVLVILVILVAWFVLVFQRTSDEINRIDGEIIDAQTQINIVSSKASQVEAMKKVIAEREEEGARVVEVPRYDNMGPLMVELNKTLSAANSYSVSFDDMSTESSGAYIHRGVGITFGCGSYSAAESIVDALVNGKYPCVIDSLTYVDGSAKGSSRVAGTSGAGVSMTLHLMYLERR